MHKEENTQKANEESENSGYKNILQLMEETKSRNLE